MTATERRPASAAGLHERGQQIQPFWRGRRHILDLDDWAPGELVQVMDTAISMKDVLNRPVRKLPTLRGKTIVTAFYESSTRTRISFEVAAKILGADAVNMTASASSVTKGESLLDTIRTLQAIGADVVVMRHPQSGAPWVVADRVNSAIVNGGDGWHAHPTQALLDLFTIREKLGLDQPLTQRYVHWLAGFATERRTCVFFESPRRLADVKSRWQSTRGRRSRWRESRSWATPH